MDDLIARLRVMEASMTPQEMNRAFAIMLGNGWKPSDTPPAWCWLGVFQKIIGAREPTYEDTY